MKDFDFNDPVLIKIYDLDGEPVITHSGTFINRCHLDFFLKNHLKGDGDVHVFLLQNNHSDDFIMNY